ncbi:MAG: hypothetical protein ACO1SX_10845 [Actinomycetota bacterium]
MEPTSHSVALFLGAVLAAGLAVSPSLADEVDPDADSLPQPERPARVPAEPLVPEPVEPSRSVPKPAPAPRLPEQVTPTPAGLLPRPVFQPPIEFQPPVAFQPPVVPAPRAPGVILAAQNPTPKTPTPATPDPAGAQKVALGDVTIYGDQIERDPATGVFVVTGNPRAVYGADELRADRLTIDPITQDFTAEGSVVIIQGGREIRATRANYRFVDREGQAEDVREQFGPYYIRAERLQLKGGPVYEALRAAFSTCEIEPTPHYQFYSRNIQIFPGKELIARNVGLDLLGHRLLTIPKLRKSLAPGGDDDRTIYPSIGYSKYTGPYARQEMTLRRGEPIWLDADYQINTFREPSGGVRASTNGRIQLRATAYYRDLAENQRVRFLQVSRLPEVGLVWSPNQGPSPGNFLPHQVGAVRYPRQLDVSTKWRIAAEVSGGYFRQHRGDRILEEDSRSKWGARVKAQAQGVLPQADLGPIRLNDLRFMARQTFYDSGDAFTVLGTGIGKRVKFKNLQLGIMRLDQYTSGSTPFLFDDVELRQEWRPRLEYNTPGFNFTYMARIRRDGGLYDQVFSVSKLFHCIEPRFTYRTRNADFFFEIRIPGLSSFGKARPGEPRTIEQERESDPSDLLR